MIVSGLPDLFFPARRVPRTTGHRTGRGAAPPAQRGVQTRSPPPWAPPPAPRSPDGCSSLSALVWSDKGYSARLYQLSHRNDKEQLFNGVHPGKKLMFLSN